MTAAFGFLLIGWLLLKAGKDNSAVADELRGVIGGGTDAGPGPRGFAASLLALGGGGNSPAAASSSSGPVPHGMVQVDGHPVCAWVARDLTAARRNGWHGHVISGYRNRQEQAAACAHTSGPCAAPGQSNHQGTAWPSCAVDVDDPAGLARALPAGSRLKWTGRTIGDSPHFSSGKHGV